MNLPKIDVDLLGLLLLLFLLFQKGEDALIIGRLVQINDLVIETGGCVVSRRYNRQEK